MLGQAAASAAGDAIEKFANSVLEMVGTAVTSLGTVWLYIATPNLTSGAGSSIPVGTTPPGSEGLVTALGYAKWIGLVLAAAAVVVLGARIAISLRKGEGLLHVGRLGVIAGAVVLIGGAGSFVAGVIPSAGSSQAGGATLFIQNGLWFYMGIVAVLSVIVGGVRMAWENRADPGVDVVKSLLTLIVVAGAGVTLTQLLIASTDTFSVWFLQQSLKCDVTTDKACFGKNITLLLSLSGTSGLGAMLIIILGFVASLAAIAQIVLMVLRSGSLVILSGVLPISAAATNTETGKNWFRRCIAWLTAFVLYKPAAAIVYAAAFQLVGSDIFRSDDSLVSVLTGLMLMLMAVVALPALMRFVTPLVGALASSAASGAVVGGLMAAMPTGAAQVGQLLAGPGGGAAPSMPSSEPTGAIPAGSGGQGPSGSSGGSSPGADGAGGPTGSGSDGGQGAPGSGSGDLVGAGVGGGSGGGGGGMQTAAAEALRGGGPAGASSGSAAGGAEAAGAAGGPAGMLAAEGASRVGEVGQAAASAARAAGQNMTGEGEPDGSN